MYKFCVRLELPIELVAFRTERKNVLGECIGFFAQRVEFGPGVDGRLFEFESRGAFRFKRGFERARLGLQLFDLLQGFVIACTPVRFRLSQQPLSAK
jgi:hypothetical protein